MSNFFNGVWIWMHSAHLPSATVLTDSTGADVRRLAYRVFGEEALNTGTGESPIHLLLNQIKNLPLSPDGILDKSQNVRM